MMGKRKKLMRKMKKGAKRNNINSFSGDNNCFINFSSSSNKFNNRK